MSFCLPWNPRGISCRFHCCPIQFWESWVRTSQMVDNQHVLKFIFYTIYQPSINKSKMENYYILNMLYVIYSSMSHNDQFWINFYKSETIWAMLQWLKNLHIFGTIEFLLPGWFFLVCCWSCSASHRPIIQYLTTLHSTAGEVPVKKGSMDPTF